MNSTPEGARTPILVADDDPDIRLALEMLLSYEGFEVWTAKDGEEAWKRLEHERGQGRAPAVVLTDLKMPGVDGLELLDRIGTLEGPPPVVMISGHGDVATAVDAMIGESPPMQQLRKAVAQVAQSDASVLITGENGTGKEVVARSVHFLGPRATGPFVTVNSAAIPGELIESELFGHEKGSFTGAIDRRTGHFEAADGGTLFLDEIGDMPIAAQAKVLRALETHEVTRVGDSATIPVNIRVLAATNADLAESVEAKTFRMDLFYRLNVVPLRVPPLRERLEDIPALAARFLSEQAERTGMARLALGDDALAHLSTLDWPGNVRQLRNLLEGAAVFASDDVIGLSEVTQVLEAGRGMTPTSPRTPGEDPNDAESFEEFKNVSEARFFELRLARNEGNVKRTAEELGMQRSHLYKKLDRYGLR